MESITTGNLCDFLYDLKMECVCTVDECCRFWRLSRSSAHYGQSLPRKAEANDLKLPRSLLSNLILDLRHEETSIKRFAYYSF